MNKHPYVLLPLLLVLASSYSCRQIAESQESGVLPQHCLRLISYDGPSRGAGLSGWIVMEVDLSNSRMRVLKQRVAYTSFSNGIPPDHSPYDRGSLAKAISDVPWRALPSQEAGSLDKLIHAWLETSPPGDYKPPKDDLGWPGHTTITVQAPRRTITSSMAWKYASPPYTDDTGELREMLFRLSCLEMLFDKDTQPPAGGDEKPAPQL